MTADRPNVLFVMADQLSACWTGPYGQTAARTPQMDRLAAEGVVFERMYCNSPICVASRASMMSGRLISAIGAYDNGSEFPASRPTFCHYLRLAGYRTVLAGKMHFIGPDQLHGFAERLTTDIYPASLDWTPDWRQEPVHNPGTSVREVRDSGVAARTLQVDYDEEVHGRAIRQLYDFARRRQEGDDRPWLLCVSYTQPHDPFVTTAQYWDRFASITIPPPTPPPNGEPPAYDQWLNIHHELDLYPLSAEHIAAARRAYLGMVAQIDDLLGDLLHHLEQAGMANGTLVIFTSDHGEMLGERGMWYKRTMYEPSSRVPFLARWPRRIPAGRHEQRVASLVDLFATFCDVADAHHPDGTFPPSDGQSLLPLFRGQPVAWKDSAISEYLGEGVGAPVRMLVRGDHKLVYVHGQPDQLYDLAADPGERHNLAAQPQHAGTLQRRRTDLLTGWRPEAIRESVLASQTERRAVIAALKRDKATAWDFQPLVDASQQYVRRRNAQQTAAEARVPHVGGRT